MSMGQRIAKKRKERNLSQEALGEALGVSRQAIYKWENDLSLPEIDKLIAMSRLFEVSVGWLLGEESETESAPPPEELTEAQLRMVEEIVARYIAAQPKPISKGRRRVVKVCTAVAAVCLVGVLLSLFSRLDQLDSQYNNLQNSMNNVTYSVNSQIGSITSQVEEVLKSQNNLTADYGVTLSGADYAANTVTFTAYAVPKTYVEGMRAVFLADDGTQTVEAEAALVEGQTFSGEITCALTDDITITVVFLSGDTRQTQLLTTYFGLYLQSMPSFSIRGDFLWRAEVEDGVLAIEEDYAYGEEGDFYDEAELDSAAIASVRIGLFRNQQIVAWAEPCPYPADRFQGFEEFDFYRFSDLRVPVEEGDALCVAAVVTDIYGRTAVYGETPVIMDETGELNWPEGYYEFPSSDPAAWDF